MWSRLGLVLMSLVILSGCTTMKPTDFKNATPQLVIEEYFAGETQAWGLFEDRFGTIRRQFSVDIVGTWDGEFLTLDEKFVFEDGERDRRIWKIRKTSDKTYTGTADDVIGEATGRASGNGHAAHTNGLNGQILVTTSAYRMSFVPCRAHLPEVPLSADQCISCFFLLAFGFALIIQYLPSAVKLTLPLQCR